MGGYGLQNVFVVRFPPHWVSAGCMMMNLRVVDIYGLLNVSVARLSLHWLAG